MQRKSWLLILIGPPALWLALLFLLPVGVMSIFTFRAGSFGAEREIFTLAHYREFLGNGSYHRLLWETTWLSFAVGVASVVLAYPVAYYLAFAAGSRRLTLLLILLVPGWISFLLRIFAWKLILGSNGALNSFLLWIGFIDEATPILLYSRLAVIVVLVYVWIPFAALPIFAALQRIDRSLFEAAADLGSSALETFGRVTLPLSLPGALAAFFLVFIPTLGEYVTPLLVGGVDGILYGNVVQSQFTRALNWPLGSLLSLVLLAVALPIMLVFSRLLRLDRLVEG
jgi:spermidine/putrescine transport system permease protein